PVLVAIGPLAATYYADLQAMPENIRPQVWVVSILPLDLNPPPDNFIAQIKHSQSLLVAEEHVERGGFGWELIMTLQKMNINLAKFRHFYARKHIYDEYGSQDLLRQKSFLDVASIISSLKDF
ncbi:transketolase, partial [bacterium]|nr:transketolase [bacterium]